jgi:hypothetical protein
MAQLGDLDRAKALLKRAGRGFGPRETAARARCAVAEAEIALVSRDLASSVKALDTAYDVLERRGDRANAAHARYLKGRYLLLIGRLDALERSLADFDPAPLPPASRAGHELVVAGLAMRRLRTKTAAAALERAERATRQAGVPALQAEVETLADVLDAPAARIVARDETRLLRLGGGHARVAGARRRRVPPRGALCGRDHFVGDAPGAFSAFVRARRSLARRRVARRAAAARFPRQARR